ncbi:DsbA family protein [Actinobacillus delphinicola]|uniref:Thiol:disulfide interchange protein n=1 Tax=Actinobacillus delphinicola TaxID=51161 RepID=A0A448TSY9_9PAST|nr:DsbA family protein [Actinobacillus delphinicola]VEJ09036.1 DSBA oxidoreductase [Actinobacillus delphinicola]
MKKLLLAFIALFGLAQANADSAYTELDRTPSPTPTVIEFFSFYCPHCYNFQYVYKIPQKVEASLPKNVTFKQYHVAFLGAQGEMLTRAWSLAMLLNVQDKVREPLFNSVRAGEEAGDPNIPTMDTVRKIFLDAGVTPDEFNAFNSFAVTALTKKQENLAQSLNVRGVPDFYVDEKYRINPEALPKNEEGFINGYVKTINDLLQKH